MADSTLSQAPLLVFPENYLEQTQAFIQAINTTNKVIQQSLEPERSAQLAQYADYIERDFPHLERCVRYYRSLLDTERSRRPYTHLSMIDAGPCATSNLSQVDLGQPLLAPRTHHLQVSFRQS